MPKGKRYTLEFRREAVKLAQSSENSLAVTAKELGMNYKTLCNWVHEAMNQPTKSTKKTSPYQELLAENVKLKRALKRAQQERDILKNCLHAVACPSQLETQFEL